MINAVRSPEKAYSQLLINRISGQYNWRAKNLALCGNFNMTNVDEIFARITADDL